jgi:hypothetical protein
MSQFFRAMLAIAGVAVLVAGAFGYGFSLGSQMTIESKRSSNLFPIRHPR